MPGKKMGPSLPAFRAGKRTLAVPKAPCGGAQGLRRGLSGRWETEPAERRGNQQAKLPFAEGCPGEGGTLTKNSTASKAETPPTPTRRPAGHLTRSWHQTWKRTISTGVLCLPSLSVPKTRRYNIGIGIGQVYQPR